MRAALFPRSSVCNTLLANPATSNPPRPVYPVSSKGKRAKSPPKLVPVAEDTETADDAVAEDDNSPLLPEFYRYVKSSIEQYPDKVVLIQVGGFYELYDFFPEFEEITDTLALKRSKKKVANGELQFAGFPLIAVPTNVGKLLQRGKSVVVIKEVRTSKEEKQYRQARLATRVVDRIITPGTAVEEEWCDTSRNNYALAIAGEEVENGVVRVGLSWCDVSTGEFLVTDATIPSLREHLARIQPAEVLLGADTKQRFPQLSNLFVESGVAGLRVSHVHFKPSATQSAIRSLMSQAGTVSDRERWKAFRDFTLGEKTAAGLLVKTLTENYQNNKNVHLFAPERYVAREVMVVNAATMGALEIRRSMKGEKKGTLVAEVDKTKTAAGARLLLSRLVAPSLSIFEINRRLDILQLFYNHTNLREQVRIFLSDCKDVERSFQRMHFGDSRPDDILRLLTTMKAAQSISHLILLEISSGRVLKKIESSVKGVLGRIHDFEQLVRESEGVVEETVPDGNEVLLGTIRWGVDEGLDEAREELGELQGEREALLRKVSEVLKAKENIKLVVDKDGPCIEVGRIRQGSDLAHVQRVVHADVLFKMLPPPARKKDVLRIRYEVWTDLYEDIAAKEEELKEMEEDIFRGIIDKWKSRADHIGQTCKALAEIDVSAGLALHARDHEFVRPVVVN
ncbi:Mismatch repair protein msh3, partial [Rhizophlyctis rosea]